MHTLKRYYTNFYAKRILWVLFKQTVFLSEKCPKIQAVLAQLSFKGEIKKNRMWVFLSIYTFYDSLSVFNYLFFWA